MSPTADAAAIADEADRFAALREFVAAHRRLFVLTGAGCSTASGIPDYRDTEGQWKRSPPMTYQIFMGGAPARARYWARSLVGWRHFGVARPNAAHRMLAQLESRGRIEALVTQNVDGLHQKAGHASVIDLHGRLDRVRCMACGLRMPREDVQHELERLNPDWALLHAAHAPDGDADLNGHAFEHFRVPYCPRCGGILKPDVVFFGENVPRERVERTFAHIEAADAMLVVGSSLMVYSGYRFAVATHRRGLPIVAINLGSTRADELLRFKIEAPCAEALQAVGLRCVPPPATHESEPLSQTADD